MNDDGGAARRLLTVAEALLEAEDFVGSKKFALLAMESDPLLDGVDWILAAADVLLASARPRINYHLNWYEVLQTGTSSETRDISSVRRQYRRLALLLRPQSRPKSAAADRAFGHVENAWKVLSDPVKKDLYDRELQIACKPSEESPGIGNAAFWTTCNNCFYIHQYKIGVERKTLICQSCRKPFTAKPLQSAPPIVPGTDSYYCVWGMFPLGFTGDFNLGVSLGNAGEEENPSISPFFPGLQSDQPKESDLKGEHNQTQNGNFDDPAKPATRKKAMVRRPTKYSADAGIGPRNAG